MIKITTIFGEDAVREYEENNELPSEEWLADNGGTTASVFAQDYSVKSPTALCDAEDFRYF